MQFVSIFKPAEDRWAVQGNVHFHSSSSSHNFIRLPSTLSEDISSMHCRASKVPVKTAPFKKPGNFGGYFFAETPCFLIWASPRVMHSCHTLHRNPGIRYQLVGSVWPGKVLIMIASLQRLVSETWLWLPKSPLPSFRWSSQRAYPCAGPASEAGVNGLRCYTIKPRCCISSFCRLRG